MPPKLPFRNVYEDEAYASDYAGLDWGETYHLVRRELPRILREHVAGRRAVDFGCGTGRSTRLLRACGFEVTGIDVSPSMIDRARELDPGGDYRLVSAAAFAELAPASADLVLAAFPFDNIPAAEKPATLRALVQLLAPTGRLVNVVSSAEIYSHEWLSFTTEAFPENRQARDGEVVRIVTRGFRDGRPADDVLCSSAAYRKLYEDAGLAVAAVDAPLGRADDGLPWLSEARIAPWVIWVLTRAA